MAMKLGEATINPGAISGDVKTIQTILAGQGYNVGPIDGNYGVQTQAAVQSFQKSKGLVPDGIIGPLTWDALHGKVPELPAIPQSIPALPPPTDSKMLLMVGLGLAVTGFFLTRK